LASREALLSPGQIILAREPPPNPGRLIAPPRAGQAPHAGQERDRGGVAPQSQGTQPGSDPFGKKGREWIAAQQLPIDERLTVDGCLRQLDFRGAELAQIDGIIAQQALGDEDVRRLMTIPGIDVVCAATLVAVIGDIRRFSTSRHLVGYLGLHPTIRQSGNGPARHGRVSKEGSAAARHVLVESARSAAKSPGPLRAFAQRTAARRGRHVATVAVARKLAVLAWHLLTRGEAYAFARPSLVRRKLRRLELTAGAPRAKPGPNPNPSGPRPTTPPRNAWRCRPRSPTDA
jgi:transposase